MSLNIICEYPLSPLLIYCYSGPDVSYFHLQYHLFDSERQNPGSLHRVGFLRFEGHTNLGRGLRHQSDMWTRRGDCDGLFWLLLWTVGGRYHNGIIGVCVKTSQQNYHNVETYECVITVNVIKK